ncbi:unnamed protein product [Peniophora sp. CBMAI 1063]|nr:unnamed protein product [Peniophora sp. CBMAI 1063]
MLLLVLLTSFIRQSWNVGVAFLCFWLFWENLALGINATVWSDTGDIKLYVYCDIATHVQMIASVVKPMTTLIISRRLYLITSLRSLEPTTKAARRRDLTIEWTLGLGIPLLVAGPLYYIVQSYRFQVTEGFGCNNSIDGSILSILLVFSWNVVPPLISITIYYPRVARTLYRHNQAVNQFLHSNGSVSRTNYFRIIVLASTHILVTLPIGIATISLTVMDQLTEFGYLPFDAGWSYDHDDWQPESDTYADVLADGTLHVVQFYFIEWMSPILALAIFGLFGATSEARTSYWRVICRVGHWFGWEPTPRTRRARSPPDDIVFDVRPPQNSMSLGLESLPSFINPNARIQVAGSLTENTDGREIDEVHTAGPDPDEIEVAHQVSDDARHTGH